MIYLHKILPMLVLPTGVTLLLVCAGLIFRRHWLCWAGVGVLWISATPIVSDQIMRAAEGWEVRRSGSAMPAAQAIVVLSYGRVQPPGDSGVSEWLDADRFFGGLELYKAKRAPLLVFTGGSVPWRPSKTPEGDVLLRYATDFGIPRESILTTPRVANTEEESLAVAEVLRRKLTKTTPPRVLLVTSAFHMRRAQLLFSHVGLDVIPFPVDFKVATDKAFHLIDLLPNAASLSVSEGALRELYGLAYYRLRWGG